MEIAEQLGSPWRLPDAIVYPTGGGTGILGMWKAFGELEALGLVSGPMPRFICVQSAETAPLVEAWSSGASDSSPVEAGHTVAVGLNVPGGVGHFRVLDIVRRSGGVVVAVDEARLRARSAEWAPRGIGPEGAACIEVLDRLYDDGMLKPGDTTVVVNTCGPEKYA